MALSVNFRRTGLVGFSGQSCCRPVYRRARASNIQLCSSSGVHASVSDVDIIVVGAGLAGLRCAALLHQHGLSTKILDANHCVGGRIRTDLVDGWVLDHGARALFTTSPECKAVLGYKDLQLHPVPQKAYVWHGGQWNPVTIPWADPGKALQQIMPRPAGNGNQGFVSTADSLRLAAFGIKTCLALPWASTDLSILERLQVRARQAMATGSA